MKSKTISRIAALLMVPAIFSSCKKQLDEYNPSGLTANTVFATNEGFETLVNSTYAYNRYWYGKEEGYSMAEMGTDIWTSGTGDVYPQITQYNNLQGANTSANQYMWETLYAGLNVANLGISMVNDVEGFTDAKKKLREAELRFLRAHFLWRIVEMWGGVHFSNVPSSGAVSTANKTSVETFYNQIFEDLQFAIANLSPTTADYGRVTIPVAKAFMARMMLTRGRNNEAIAYANDVIKNYNYSLLPNYRDLWNMGKLKNSEVIWAVDYSTNLALNDARTASLFPSGHPRGSNNGHLFFLMVYDQVRNSVLKRDIPNGRPFNRYMPTLSYLNLFDDNIDSRYDGSFQTVWRANTAATGWAVGDTVALASKYTLPSGTTKYTKYDVPAVYGSNGVPAQRRFYVSLSKFKDSTRPSFNEAQSARDVFVMRLAEMYLIAGEAEMKIGKADSAAYYINIVRRRAAWPGQQAAMEVAPSAINIDFILDERARELGGEQLRFFDLKRTDKLISRINSMNPDAAVNVQPFHMLRPIPQSQIDAVQNKEEFKQNPGYQ